MKKMTEYQKFKKFIEEIEKTSNPVLVTDKYVIVSRLWFDEYTKRVNQVLLNQKAIKPN